MTAKPDWVQKIEDREQARIGSGIIDRVKLSVPSFGVQRRLIREFRIEHDAPGAFVIVSGTPKQRAKMLVRVRRHRGVQVIEKGARGGDVAQWGVARTEISRQLQRGRVIIPAFDVPAEGFKHLAHWCFSSGALWVIALCLTTEYEDGWDEEGFTGVWWMVNEIPPS